MKHSTGKPTKAERARFQRLRDIGCIACRQLLRYSVPEAHHQNLDGHAGQERLGHDHTVPLCPYHHRGTPPLGFTLREAATILGPSLARNPRRFRERFGSDEQLLARTNKLLEAIPAETKLDDMPLRFGKHKGQTPKQIARHDPSYITWLRANVFPSVCSRELALDCEEACSDPDREIDEVPDGQ